MEQNTSTDEIKTLQESNKKLCKLMEEMRVILISYVNQCKCNAEANNRVKFNLLMEKYYDYKDNSNSGTANNGDNNNNTNTNNNNNNVDYDLSTKFDNSIITDLKIEVSTTGRELSAISDGKSLRECNRQSCKKSIESRHKPRAKLTKVNGNCDDNTITLANADDKSTIYACSWPGCDSVFKAKFDLKSHMWRHTGERMFACEWPGCDKRFPVKKNLVQHRETHGTKNYACDWPGCEYRSWYPQGVRAHRKRHTDERPHKCSWPHCEWTFRQSHHLKAHMLKHTGEKPFLCSWPSCDHRFQSRQAMKFHLERAHKTPPL